jgi:hypothetical protein
MNKDRNWYRLATFLAGAGVAVAGTFLAPLAPLVMPGVALAGWAVKWFPGDGKKKPPADK